MTDTFKRIETITREHLGINPGKKLGKNSAFDSIGADSLDKVELVMAFEEEFDMEIPDDEAATLKTLGDAQAYIEKRKMAA